MVDLVSQVEADVTKSAVARGIRFLWIGHQQVLPCALGDNDHRMFPSGDPVSKGLKQSAGSVQFERHLGNETEVYALTGQCGITSDESGFAPHQLHQADAIACTDGLDMRAGNSFYGLGERSFKTKTLVQVWNVVVNRLGIPTILLRRPLRAIS